MGLDLGLLILRLVIGVLFFAHGMQKISHFPGGHGLAGGIAEFRRDGFVGGAFTAFAAGAGQISSGLLLMSGFLTPLAGMIAAGVMTVAVTVKASKGFWVQDDGAEFPFVLTVLAISFAFMGPGSYSVDAALHLDRPAWWVGVVAGAVGVGAAFAMRALMYRPAVIAAQDAASSTER